MNQNDISMETNKIDLTPPEVLSKIEQQRCVDDPAYWYEKYWQVDSKPVVLTDEQKEFLRAAVKGDTALLSKRRRRYG